MSDPTVDPRGTRLCGWKAIADHLAEVTGVRVTPWTAMTYSRLATDPMPVRCNQRTRGGATTAWSTYLTEWARRQRGDETLPRIETWAAICKALGGVAPHVAWRWAKRAHDRLPVHGIAKGAPGHPWIFESALRDWVHGGDMPHRVAHPERRTKAPSIPWAITARGRCKDVAPETTGQ